MTQFRKKPVVIDAFQFARRNNTNPGQPDWFHDAVTRNDVILRNTGKWNNPTEPSYCEIKTLEGVMRADEGDWIIRGIKDEIYACKADIFAATYEAVDAREAAERQSIDTPEFRELLGNMLDSYRKELQGGPMLPYEKARVKFIAHIDTWGARRDAEAVPDVLFDGKAVYDEVKASDPNTHPTSDHVSDVLDAVVRLIRRGAAPAAGNTAPLAYIAPHVMESLRAGCHVATVLKPQPEGIATEALYGAARVEQPTGEGS